MSHENQRLRRLQDLGRIALELQSEAIADEANALAERAAEGRFYVACVGQFKRGKSSLINALVQAEILPTGTVPVTSVVTVLRHGPHVSARLRRAGSDWEEVRIEDLPEFVSEERNPGNTKGVIAVEVYSPAPLLETGLCFVDTPGLGSVFEANSEATRDFVPHVDAALVVFGADPPLSGEEADLVQQIARHVDTFIFVLNKADRVTERECDEAADFARRVLSQRLAQPIDPVYRVSALERTASGKPTRDWVRLEERLRSLALGSRTELVNGAVDRGLRRLGARLRNIIAEEEAALRSPLEETERRIQALHRASDDAALALWQLGPLFDAEMRRLGSTFEERRKAFIAGVLPEAQHTLSTQIRALPGRFGPALRAAAMARAKEVARGHVLPWLRNSEAEAAQEYRRATERFASIVNDLLQRLRSSDAWSQIPLPEEVGDDEALRSKSRFLFESFTHVESPAGIVPMVEWLGDVLLPKGWTLRCIERAASAYLEHMVVANAHRVENSIKQRLQDSRMRLESQIRFALKEVLEAAQRGLETARTIRSRGEDAVRAALARLDGLRQDLNRIA